MQQLWEEQASRSTCHDGVPDTFSINRIAHITRLLLHESASGVEPETGTKAWNLASGQQMCGVQTECKTCNINTFAALVGLTGRSITKQ